MFLFITAIGILAASAVLCALLAVRPPSKATGRTASVVGVLGALLAALQACTPSPPAPGPGTKACSCRWRCPWGRAHWAWMP